MGLTEFYILMLSVIVVLAICGAVYELKQKNNSSAALFVAVVIGFAIALTSLVVDREQAKERADHEERVEELLEEIRDKLP